jgi:hypothetical protein
MIVRCYWIVLLVLGLGQSAWTQQSTLAGGVSAFSSAGGLTNNQSTAVNFAKAPFTVTPPATFGAFSIGDNTGVGVYNFLDGIFLKGNGGGINNKNNSLGYATWDISGNFVFGGPANNNNYFNAPYAAMSAGMMTNINPPYDAVAHLYPVPILVINSYSDMGCTPNGAWSTNTIALVDTVAPGWFAMGWSNIWYDCGQLTNRVGVANHITNNGTAFPQGITGIVTYAHSHGFGVGAYLAHGQVYCAGSPGIPTIDSFIFQDVMDVGIMGFDFLKVDYCGNSTPYTDGLPYAPGATMLTRHYAMFPEANYNMSFQLGRKPLYLETTEVFATQTSAWHVYNTLAGFNAYENGSPPGDGTWQGGLTNFIFEMVNNHETRPGHWVRQNALTGATAIQARGTMTVAAVTPSSVFLGSTNLIGNAAASPFYTNSLVNFGIIRHPLVLPGYEVISNSANHTVVIARPLGPLNGRPTTASAFNGGSFGIGLGGYTTFGTDGTNAVGVFNLDTGAHTQVINVTNIGCPSNAVIQVYDVWGNSLLGTFVNQYTTPSIPAADSSLYEFVVTKSVTDGSSAAVGDVGEVISSLVASGSAISLSTGTAANITSISLTAGDWDVSGVSSFAGASATMSQTVGGISTTSATLPTDGTQIYSADQTVALSVTNAVSIFPKQITVSTATTVYLVGKVTFSAGTVTGFGAIRARRVR